MANGLYNLPVLGAYMAAQDRAQQRDASQLDQGMRLMQMGDMLRQQQQRTRLQEMAQMAGGDPNKLIEGYMRMGDAEGAARVAQATSAMGRVRQQEAQRQFFTPENIARFRGPDGSLNMDAMMTDALGSNAVDAQAYVQHAQTVQQRREAAAERAQQAVRAMEQKREELAMRMEDKSLDRAMRAQIAAQQQQLTAMIARGNQAIQAMMAQTAQQNADMRRDDLTYRRDKDAREKADKGATNLATSLDKDMFPGLLSTTRMLNDTLSKYTPTDVPGVGYAKNLGLANFFLTPEGKRVKSQVQAISNDLLKLYSGGAVTANEAERRTTEQMASGAFGAQDLYNAWPIIVGRVNAVLGNRMAGAEKSAVDAYRARPGSLPLEQITPTTGRIGPAQPSGIVVRTPDGQEFTFRSQKEADNFKRDAGLQ